MQHIFHSPNGLGTIYMESPAYADLVLVQCGEQKYVSSDSPTVWKHIIVHYVYAGRGLYTLNGKKFSVKTWIMYAGAAIIERPRCAFVQSATPSAQNNVPQSHAASFILFSFFIFCCLCRLFCI